MTWVNLDDVRRQMEAAGITINDELKLDNSYQRWPTTTSKGKETPGWSRLKEWVGKSGGRYVVGYFGVWEGTDDGYQRVQMTERDDLPKLSDKEIAARKAAVEASRKALAEKRKAEQKQAAGWAATVWSKCVPIESHDYLVRKAIQAHGAREWRGADDLALPGVDEANFWRLKKSVGALAVPMHDINGNVVGLQFIFPKGHEFEGKQFWPTGMAMGGSFGVIGGWRRSGVLCLTEGFATAATLAESCALPAAYAFSANNLSKAAKAIRAKYKQLRILVCADDDYQTEQKTGKNPGQDAAQMAASEIELAAWVAPCFGADDANGNWIDIRDGRKLSDFNDLATIGPPLAVTNQINAKLDALKWRDGLPLAGAAGSAPEGGGEYGRRAMSVMALDDIVARFIPLDDGTGKYVWDSWTNKIAHREQMICLLPAGVRGDDIKRHPVYIDRGAYFLDQVGFDPSGKDRAVKLNTWRGWQMEPREGKCDRLLELLAYLCSGDANSGALYKWVLRWMAYPLQHPGAKMSSAIIMHGPQGTGKSTVWQCLAKIYGDYATVLNQRGLEDRFNSDWVDSKLFILAEEVVTRAEMWHIKNELKELISGPWIRVNPKNVAAYRQRNQVNGVFLSNENQPLPLDNDDRRHCVIYTPPAVGEEYYDEVHLEIERGGVEALYHYLLHLDLGDFHPKKRPPMTEAKAALIALSTPSEMRFAHEWASGELGFPICPALSTDVYAAYLRWCRAHGESRPRPDNQFHGALGRIAGWERKRARIYLDSTFTGGTHPRWLVIPPAHLLDAEMAKKKEGVAESVWLTTCTEHFSDGLKGGDDARRDFG